MRVVDLEHARGSLARGLAGQALVDAAQDNADMARILMELHSIAPNPRSRQRFAARLRGRRGVVSARTVADGLVILLRSVMTVDLRKDGAACFREDRIAWTRVHVRSGKRAIGFQMDAVHATRHVLQRRVERSDCPLDGLLGDMDAAMARALTRLAQGGVLTDREDDYLLAQRGVWAGGTEVMPADPAWGPAFRHGAALEVFAIRTFLGEEEMRPTVWLGWSEATSGARAA
ncbi:hypothetical protein SAMN05444007_11440 [Cribrihabitans marinus]|uniref:Uncharacterized protein n=1 Tax=Cribrihabitans marinus TaxID=1227549 RepID=A0A1H7DU62_9RHOB|nr:hypothetical protein [Cribrihabitans marinus]GGH40167.1 hypothetical protein GCM10010973_36450 [Cribrihabitans marinus]SEK05286.1 hypothetical protein SAMN05444007_11440 [Cribrihabitans marinus]